PALSFSYFDPNAKKYETARSAPLSVTISPSQADNSLTAAQVAAGAPQSDKKAADSLRPDHPEGSAHVASLMPLYMQPKFLILPSVLALAFSAMWMAMRRRRDEEGPRGRIPSKTAKRVLAQMEAAARARNAALFFELARRSMVKIY